MMHRSTTLFPKPAPAQTTAERDPARAEDTRGRILDAAADLFRTLGYEKTTVADIAKATDMSPANIYRFFENKADIIAQVADRWLYSMDSELARIAEQPGSAEDRLRRFVREHHLNQKTQHIHERKVHDLCALVMNEHWPVVERHIQRYGATIEAILHDGVAAGEFAIDDIPQTAGLIRSALVKYKHPRLIAECIDQDLIAEAMQVIDLLLTGLRPRP